MGKLFVCCGYNEFGKKRGGGVGRVVQEQIDGIPGSTE